MDSIDPVIAGMVLLAIVPLLSVEYPAYRRGGYDSAFWRLPLDEKLDHIATQQGHWTRLGAVWIPVLLAAVGGMAALTFQLVGLGAGPWPAMGLGIYGAGAAAWLVGVVVQTTVVRSAARIRRETGTTPAWLDGFWSAAWWFEMAFVLAANVAAVAWGIAIVDTGYPADWSGWAAIVVGALAVVIVAFTREGFPHLGVIVPVMLGVALVLY